MLLSGVNQFPAAVVLSQADHPPFVSVVVIEEETQAMLERLGLATCSFTTMDGINSLMSDINLHPLITEELKMKLLNAAIWCLKCNLFCLILLPFEKKCIQKT